MHRFHTLIAGLGVVVALALLMELNGGRPRALADAGETLAPLTGDTPLSNAPDETALFPTLVYNGGADEYLAVWRSTTLNGAADIVARRVAGSGVPLGDPIPITADANVQSIPAVAYNTLHAEYLIVWCDESVSGIPIVGQRVRGDGSLLGATIPLASKGCGNTRRPSLAYNPVRDEYLMVWDISTPITSGTYDDIVGRRLAADAAPIGEAFAISSAAGSQIGPSVVYNASRNEYFVAWVDGREQNRKEVYAQQLTSTGVLQGGEFAVVTGINTSYWPGLAYNNADNQYLVTWNDTITQRFGAQIISADGATIGVSNTLGAATGAYVHTTAAYSAARHEYFVAWSSGAAAATNTLSAQRLSSLGQDIGEVLALPAAAEGQILPVVVAGDGGDKYLAVWSQAASPGTSVEGRLFGFTSAATPTPTISVTPTTSATATISSTPTSTSTATPTATSTTTPVGISEATPTARPRLWLPAVER